MLPSFSEILVDGPDTLHFMQGQLAADVKAIDLGCWAFAAYCLPDGRVQALMIVARENEDRLSLLLPTDLASTVLTRLQRYRLRARCELSSRPVSVVQPESSCVTRRYSCAGFSWGVNATQSAAIDDSLWSAQVQLAVPWLVTGSSEKFLPQMLSLERLAAYSLRKGCFPGQEVVARMHFLGRSKRHLVSLHRTEGDCALIPGQELHAAAGTGEPCGWAIADDFPRSSAALAVITESAPELLRSGADSSAQPAIFVNKRESTGTKGDKLLNERCFSTSDA